MVLDLDTVTIKNISELNNNNIDVDKLIRSYDLTNSTTYGNYSNSASPANITGAGSLQKTGYSEYWKTKNSWGVGSHYGDRKLKIWWTRSPGVAYKLTSLYTALTNSNSANYYEANFSRGVIPCFAVF